jgi:hypothetical protein
MAKLYNADLHIEFFDKYYCDQIKAYDMGRHHKDEEK